MRKAVLSLTVPCLVILGLLLLKPRTSSEKVPMSEAELRAAQKEWKRFWMIDQKPRSTENEEANKDDQQNN